MATAMMAVVTAAWPSPSSRRSAEHIPTTPEPLRSLQVDAPAIFVVASIALTALALGALKGAFGRPDHAPDDPGLPGSTFSLLTAGRASASQERPLLYWFQAAFAILVTSCPWWPGRIVKNEMERGPRRTWWKKTTEAVVFSFLTVSGIVMFSGWLQLAQRGVQAHRPACSSI